MNERERRLDELSRAAGAPISRREALVLLGKAVLVAAVPLALRPGPARGAGGPGTVQCNCPSINGLFYVTYCAPEELCCCFARAPGVEGGAGCCAPWKQCGPSPHVIGQPNCIGCDSAGGVPCPDVDHCCDGTREDCVDGRCLPKCTSPEVRCGVVCCDPSRCQDGHCAPVGGCEIPCGPPGHCCDPATQRCVDGACVPRCAPGQTECGPFCCEPNETCDAGRCRRTCRPPLVECRPGVCCDPRTHRCVSGRCVPRCTRAQTACGADCCRPDERCVTTRTRRGRLMRRCVRRRR